MRSLKPVNDESWPIPLWARCVYEKRVNNGPFVRCRYTNKGNGYCGIHEHMMQQRRKKRDAAIKIITAREPDAIIVY